MKTKTAIRLGCALLILASTRIVFSDEGQVKPLPGTKPLTMKGDIAAQLVAGVDKFLLREIDRSVPQRAGYWKRNTSSVDSYNNSIKPNRERLAHILGVRDKRVPFEGLEIVGTTEQPALVGRGDGIKIFSVRWPAIRDIHGEGLLLVPDNEKKIIANVVAIPDADQTPEQIAGLVDGVPAESQFARRLAENGCRVVVPMLISREMNRRAAAGRTGGANLTNREFLYRSAFELGRHLIGYELQKTLAVVDWFEKDAGDNDPNIGVIGYGEGGMLAMYAAALDTRIDAACVSGYFGPRERIWEQPLDRNVYGLLEQFGDAEVAAMIAPRGLVIDSTPGPELELPSQGGAPAVLKWPEEDAIAGEWRRLSGMVRALKIPQQAKLEPKQRTADHRMLVYTKPAKSFCDARITTMFLGLTLRSDLVPNDAVAKPLTLKDPPEHLRTEFDPQPRQQRQIHEIDDHNQWLLSESPYVRRDFMNIGLTRDDRKDGKNKLDTSSPKAYKNSVERFRTYFRHEVVGDYPYELSSFNVRTRLAYEGEKWTGYEVVLNVFPDVIAYGILCIPKGIKEGEMRPCVVCQHGLEGRPQSVIGKEQFQYYKAFATDLADRGFITFAPQNLYIGKDNFRTLQRKANSIKKTLFSIMVPQHHQIVSFLKTLPEVDSKRIAFYGLSYGGKSAMRIPPLVTDYCLSICSADFNEWVWKNASSRARYSYVFTGEYEIFEFDLGSTFNYAEMAALIAPRPFMVERGHFDGVAPDETVAYEFAKVRHLYAARLDLPDHCEIEWFKGPHTINGKKTFDFLHKHLDWPKPK